MSDLENDTNNSDSELEPSELGTKNFWEQQYESEMKNFLEFGDIGEIWFGKRIMDLIVNWVEQKFDRDAPILDLGCGNGILLIRLAQQGFKQLTGVDYSSASIELATAIANSHKANISYKVLDILEPVANKETTSNTPRYNLLLDKGTYDAISLMENYGPSVRERYLSATSEMLSADGLFLLTTCNWTRTEIIQHMEKYYVPLDFLPTPTIQFGGKQGNNVSVVVFKKI